MPLVAEEAAENEQPDPAERLALCELCGLDLDRNTSALVQVVCNQKQCRERQGNTDGCDSRTCIAPPARTSRPKCAQGLSRGLSDRPDREEPRRCSRETPHFLSAAPNTLQPGRHVVSTHPRLHASSGSAAAAAESLLTRHGSILHGRDVTRRARRPRGLATSGRACACGGPTAGTLTQGSLAPTAATKPTTRLTAVARSLPQ